MKKSMMKTVGYAVLPFAILGIALAYTSCRATCKIDGGRVMSCVGDACRVFDKKTSEEVMPETFVDVTETMKSADYDIRYYGKDNFVGARVDGYEAPKCILTKSAADALANVEKELEAYGLKVLIFDCYRPQRAVNHFVRWAADVDDVKMKGKYYPYVDKKDLFKDGFIAEKSGHTRGSVVDLTIEGLQMGTGFDYFGKVTNTVDPNILPEARRNRLLLKVIMEKNGFENYDQEWWHYKLKDEPYPGTFFDFPVK